MRRAARRRLAAGFTLIELMVVVGIISIMTAMAIGLTTNWRRQSQFRTVAREIYNGLSLARANAIKRGSQVKFAMISTPEHALYVFADADGDHQYVAGTDGLIYTFPTDQDDWPKGYSDIAASIDPVILTANSNHQVLIFDAYGLHVDINGEPLGSTPATGAIMVQDAISGDKLYVDVTIAGALRIRDQ